MRRRRDASSPGEQGFTVLEMVVTLLLFTVVMAAALALFTVSGRVSRVQTAVADMQQSLRIAQYDMLRFARMAGRGGVPVGVLPQGLAVGVRNNVPEPSYIDVGTDSIEIQPDTDVLTIRGVLSTTVYRITPGTFFVDNPPPGVPTSGGFSVSSAALPTVPIPQNLQPFVDAVNDGSPEALIVVSPLDDRIYHVVELDPGASDVSNPTDHVTIGFRVGVGGTHTAAYWTLSNSTWHTALTDAAYVGILEEHRYYIRRDFAIPGDPSSEPQPKLVRAHVYPGTESPHNGNAANWRLELADNIVDLQVAMGLDTDGDGFVTDNNDGADEWLYNSNADDDTLGVWNLATNRFYYLRINTLAFTDRRDRGYQAPLLNGMEDRVYAASDPLINVDSRRLYRRRQAQSLVDMRNVL